MVCFFHTPAMGTADRHRTCFISDRVAGPRRNLRKPEERCELKSRIFEATTHCQAGTSYALPAIVLAVLAAGVATLSCAADLTADQVRQLLATADLDRPADLTGKDLSDLDLSNIDFKRANLSGANLFASRLVSSNLAGAKLARANLNGAWLMGTKFAGADLSGSSMLSLVILGGQVKDKPNFAGANLSGVRMIADLRAPICMAPI